MKKKYNPPLLTVCEYCEEDIIMVSKLGFQLFGDIELESQEYDDANVDWEDYEE